MAGVGRDGSGGEGKDRSVVEEVGILTRAIYASRRIGNKFWDDLNFGTTISLISHSVGTNIEAEVEVDPEF